MEPRIPVGRAGRVVVVGSPPRGGSNAPPGSGAEVLELDATSRLPIGLGGLDRASQPFDSRTDSDGPVPLGLSAKIEAGTPNVIVEEQNAVFDV